MPRLRRVGARVLLREATEADAKTMNMWQSDRAYWMGEFNYFDSEPERDYVAELAGNDRLVTRDGGTLLVEHIVDGSLLGDVTWRPARYGPNERSKCWNIGIALIPSARGQGYGAEAQRLFAELLFDVTAAVRVEASTDVQNTAEIRSLEKAGFVREGVARQAQYRRGEWHDMMVYSVVRADLTA